jgi:hypothetical protein
MGGLHELQALTVIHCVWTSGCYTGGHEEPVFWADVSGLKNKLLCLMPVAWWFLAWLIETDDGGDISIRNVG